MQLDSSMSIPQPLGGCLHGQAAMQLSARGAPFLVEHFTCGNTSTLNSIWLRELEQSDQEV